MSNLVYKLFNRGVKWNAFEGIIYQSVLTIHQVILFTVSGYLLYGLIGVLYSILYLSILFFNFGFDKSLATFFASFTKNKKLFKRIFVSQFLVQFIFLGLIFFSIVLFNNEIIDFFSGKFKCPRLDFGILIILGLLLLSESSKKSLRFVCELAFLNKSIAITEICLILFYTCAFWVLYFFGYGPDLYLVFLPHLIQSIVGALIFIYFVFFKIYRLLPDNNNQENLTAGYFKDIISNRFSNYLNQLSHLLFSGNFVIPFLSSIYGVEQISIFKLLNVISIYFTVILERTFGLTSGALLSHLQNLSKSVKQNALNLATKKLVIVLYAIIIFLLFNFQNFLHAYYKISNINWLSLYLFLFAIIFENFFITMEQFFIVEDKIYYFVLINLLAASMFYFSANMIISSLTATLLLFVIIRILSFIFLKEILRIRMNVNLNFKISFKYIVYFILAALFFLIVVKYYLKYFKITFKL